MKKILMIALCLVLVPMLFGAESNADGVSKTVGPTNAAPIQLQKSSSPRRVPQSRDLLFSQIPSTTANAVSCQLDSVYPFESDLVEDVTPTEDWMIDSVVGYVGYWGSWVGWSLVPNVRFLVYADSSIGNHPVDSPFVEIIIDQGTYETAPYGAYYTVGLPLPYSVNLTAGVTYWLEVQPCFSFAANGQSGTMAEVGIGNGQEFFSRFPLLGTLVFTTAAGGGWAGQEAGIELYGTTGGAVLVWDFETGYQGWTSTNGLGWPGGWEPYDAAEHAGSGYQCPNSDALSMEIDSDEYYAATEDTALSPILVPNPTMDWLKYGFYHNDITTPGGDFLEVGIKYFDGATWNVVPLTLYDSDFFGNWDSVDVSAYVGYSQIQIYFFYYAADWDWYAAFDNVSIDATIYSADHDVASIEFLSPGFIVTPGLEDVIGVVANLGSSDETYDVHCVVTDPSVVLDVTLNVTTPVGETDTLNFGSVDFQDGNTYDIMMATLLAGDTDPSNDTLTQSTYCTAIYWEILTNMPYTSSGAYAGYSMDAASNTYVHVFGGNPGPQNDHYIYDVTNASWSTGTPLPMVATYGGFCSINNKIYMIGAWGAGPDALMTIYDADSDIYTTVALPGGTIANPGIAVKDNNLIYIVGGARPAGWTGSTIVNVYDVAGDSFFTNVTQLPAGDEKMSAGTAMITGDTIVVAAGINAAGTHEDKVLFGAIDPANPANITWTTGPSYPPGACYRLYGGSWEGTAYFTGGTDNATYFTATVAYVPGTGWVTLPDKPTGVSNFGWVMAAVDTSLVDDVEGYGIACGGYSPYSSAFEALHTGIITGIYEQPSDVPVAFTSRMISSNPVVDRAKIEFAMPHKGPVTFSIYDISGRRILDSKYSSISAGTHTILWSCEDDVGRDVPSGIYFYRLEAAGNVATGKLVIVQ